MPVLDPILINAVFVGVVLLLGAVVAAIVSNRASKTLATKSALETLEASYTKLQATYLVENDRLNVKVDRLQNEKDAASIQQSNDKIECARQIASQQVQITELQRQITLLIGQGADMVRKVVIVGADIPKTSDGKVANPLPVVIEGPLPIPMTAVERAALAAEAAAKVDKE